MCVVALRALLAALLAGGVAASVRAEAEKLEKAERLERAERLQSAGRVEKAGKLESAERLEKAKKLEKTEKAGSESAARSAKLRDGTFLREGTILKVRRQTPEELGFSDTGEAPGDGGSFIESQYNESKCLDLGAKGFPIPVFKLMQDLNWDGKLYFDVINAKGYAEDALQMTGPQSALLKTSCMKASFHGRVKHIFVGDSQMMALRNAFHRQNGCPEIWYKNHTQEETQAMHQRHKTLRATGHLHSATEQSPEFRSMRQGCTEEGVASFIFWDAWAQKDIPVKEIQAEIEMVGVSPKEGDTVVVWVGSNSIKARLRMGVLLRTIDRLQPLGVRMVWDSPTFHDEAIMAATSSANVSRDRRSNVDMIYSAISRRKERGEMGSNEYQTERTFLEDGVEIPMTKRWQLTNRYRGLQCDGIHTSIQARDPLFYARPCPGGPQKYGKSTYCSWVEPMKEDVVASCPAAQGLDDLVLQSGLYALCAAHERPFCYAYTERIR